MLVRAVSGAGNHSGLCGIVGVGKSTIINGLADAALRVQPVREQDDRGQHTTTSRQMIFLPGGGIVIDTPGMRELQLWNHEQGVEQAFEDIATLSQSCKFRDCGHHGEPGCAVGSGRSSVASWHSIGWRTIASCRRSLSFQERKVNPVVARQVKEKWKKIHKAMRNRPDRF